MQEPSSPSQDGSQDQGQDQPSSSSQVEVTPQDDQGQHFGQDGDPNDQDDQVIIPRSNEGIEARRLVRVLMPPLIRWQRILQPIEPQEVN